jgi:hypothetical protein
MELPTPPFERRWSVILAGVIGLAAIAALLGWRNFQEVATPETTTTTVPATTAAGPVTTTTLPPTSRTSPSRPDDILWRKQGSDVARSHGFTAPSTWRIEWAFDCTNFERYGGGNFKITGDGAFEGVQIEQVDVQGSGKKTFTLAGFGHLLVESVCDRWTVTVLAG